VRQCHGEESPVWSGGRERISWRGRNADSVALVASTSTCDDESGEQERALEERDE
jgi:hypothetical protein